MLNIKEQLIAFNRFWIIIVGIHYMVLVYNQGWNVNLQLIKMVVEHAYNYVASKWSHVATNTNHIVIIT